MWVGGYVEVLGSKIFYTAKVYDKPSKYGINEGRISKLFCGINNTEILSYDRGWVITVEKSPYPGLAAEALKQILEKYA